MMGVQDKKKQNEKDLDNKLNNLVASFLGKKSNINMEDWRERRMAEKEDSDNPRMR